MAGAIDKPALARRYGDLAVDPYSLSPGIVVERFCFARGKAGEKGRISAESRSRRLDGDLVMTRDLSRLNGTHYVRPATIARRVSSATSQAHNRHAIAAVHRHTGSAPLGTRRSLSEAEPRVVRISLQEFLAGAGESQVRASEEGIPKSPVETGKVVEIDALARK